MVTVSMRMSGRATPRRRSAALEPVTRPSVVTHANSGSPVRTKAVCSTIMTTDSGTMSFARETMPDSARAYAASANVRAKSPNNIG